MEPNPWLNYRLNYKASRKIHQFSIVGFARHLPFVFSPSSLSRIKMFWRADMQNYIHKIINFLINILDTSFFTNSISSSSSSSTSQPSSSSNEGRIFQKRPFACIIVVVSSFIQNASTRFGAAVVGLTYGGPAPGPTK